MERAVEIFAVIHLGVMGLSHILVPQVWIDLFVRLRERGHLGVFATGSLSLFTGSIIAAFHNVWSWPGVVLTLLGWAQVLKGTLYFLFPALGMHGLRRVDPERPRDFILAGAGLLLMAGFVVCGWL